MSDQAIGHAPSTSAPTPCENCGTELQGHYCHICGQSMHSPVRHVGHAVEEVFESFWHLDGRVFRTLRDLLVPGKVALQYLAGHRVRYIAPLRMFVILSLLTFFIGQMTVDIESSGAASTSTDLGPITRAQSEAEVREARDRLLAEVTEARREIADNAPIPGLDAVMIREEVRIRGEADNRIVQLRRAAMRAGRNAGDGRPEADGPDADAAPGDEVATVDPTPGDDPTASGETGASEPEWEGPLFSTDSEAWNPQKNRVQIGWLPDFANDWLTRRLGYANDNVQRMNDRPGLYAQTFMKALPSALFVLVPVFALLLKFAYLFKRRLYLEHMVIALYSHCFLLLALAAIFLLSGLGGAVKASMPWLSLSTTLAATGIGLWAPLYLLLMQKRAYGQGWPMTILKYLVVGFIYFMMLSTAAAVMFVVTLAKPT